MSDPNKERAVNEQTLAGDNQELDAPRAVDVTPNHAADELDVGRLERSQ